MSLSSNCPSSHSLHQPYFNSPSNPPIPVPITLSLPENLFYFFFPHRKIHVLVLVPSSIPNFCIYGLSFIWWLIYPISEHRLYLSFCVWVMPLGMLFIFLLVLFIWPWISWWLGGYKYWILLTKPCFQFPALRIISNSRPRVSNTPLDNLNNKIINRSVYL